MQNAFGSGSFFGTDTGTNPTPVKFGVLQDAAVDFSASAKELYGSFQFPVTVARGQGKIGVKVKMAQLMGRLINNLFFNGTLAAGQTQAVDGEAGTITATAVTVSGSATFVDDLGVIRASTGLPFVRVAAAPAVGQYTVAAGVYGFNATDNAVAVLVSYTKTIPTTGQQINIANAVMGVAPIFKSVFTNTYNSLRNTLTLNACVSTKLTYGTKLEDFVHPEFDASAFADTANNIGTWSVAEAT